MGFIFTVCSAKGELCHIRQATRVLSSRYVNYCWTHHFECCVLQRANSNNFIISKCLNILVVPSRVCWRLLHTATSGWDFLNLKDSDGYPSSLKYIQHWPRSAPAAVIVSLTGKGKGKSVPLQAWSGPEGSRKLRFPDFMTTAQEGGKVISFTHRPPLSPGNPPGTHFC